MGFRGVAAVTEAADNKSSMHAIACLDCDCPGPQMSVRSEASETNIFDYMISRQCRLENLSSNLAGVRHIFGYTVLDLDDRPVGDSANWMIKCIVASVFA